LSSSMYFMNISISFAFIPVLFTWCEMRAYKAERCLIYRHADWYWSLKDWRTVILCEGLP
jgi:hypothetical protein